MQIPYTTVRLPLRYTKEPGRTPDAQLYLFMPSSMILGMILTHICSRSRLITKPEAPLSLFWHEYLYPKEIKSIFCDGRGIHLPYVAPLSIVEILVPLIHEIFCLNLWLHNTLDTMASTKILVANRGEIAVRIFRTAHELSMTTIAVYAEEDENGGHRQSEATHWLT